MERLTERWGDGDVWVKEHDYVSAAHRLADYEDTGLTPEEITKVREDIEAGYMKSIARAYGIDVERLKKLARNDREGRVVVLPCKVGDTVYWVHGAAITECKVYRIQKNRNGLYICLKSNVSHGAFRTDLSFGKTVFLTREEAEKALEEIKDG